MRTTLLTNVFNEEYLLPFWLHHHKNMFDDIIIIDYRSTDKSVEICKNICPDCIIMTSRNPCFDAEEVDKEFMDIESSIEGIKVVLNTTEFLFCYKPLREIFAAFTKPISLKIKCEVPYSTDDQNHIHNHYELLYNFIKDVRFQWGEDRSRYIHTYQHGDYTVGRHTTNHENVMDTEDMHLVWLGFYPMNEHLLNRKLQIKHNIPQKDVEIGFGVQHMLQREEILNLSYFKAMMGGPLDSRLRNHIATHYLKLDKTFVVTGGCGFIGSHMTDRLIGLGYKVVVVDNLLSGRLENLNKDALLEQVDISDFDALCGALDKYKDELGGIFHFAAIARTPWCMDDPLLCYKTNVMGTINVLEAARRLGVKRVVLSSSNVVYAFFTPYRTSKEALEGLSTSYHQLYNISVIALRYSNVYGKRQSEEGPSPNVFAALRKSKKDRGKLLITGDGTQTRNYTHVSDIVTGNLLAMCNDYCGVIDLCTGVSVPLNDAAKYFQCPIEYIAEREGDVKHIIQSPDEAYHILGWKALTTLEAGIPDVL